MLRTSRHDLRRGARRRRAARSATASRSIATSTTSGGHPAAATDEPTRADEAGQVGLQADAPGAEAANLADVAGQRATIGDHHVARGYDADQPTVGQRPAPSRRGGRQGRRARRRDHRRPRSTGPPLATSRTSASSSAPISRPRREAAAERTIGVRRQAHPAAPSSVETNLVHPTTRLSVRSTSFGDPRRVTGRDRRHERQREPEPVRGDSARLLSWLRYMLRSPTMSVASPTAIIAGASIARLSVISATISITASGAWATLPNSAIIATITNGAGSNGIAGAIGSSSRQIPAPSRPPMTMPGPEDAAGAAGADRQRGRQDLGERQREDHPERDREEALAVEPGLDPAVPGAKDSGNRQPDAADDEASHRGPQLARQADRSEPIGEPVEGRDVEPTDDARGHPDERVVQQLTRILEARLRRRDRRSAQSRRTRRTPRTRRPRRRTTGRGRPTRRPRGTGSRHRGRHRRAGHGRSPRCLPPCRTATAIRASRASRSSRRARYDPNPAPIWAVGPSRPPDPPDPIVIAEATSLISGMRARTRRAPWWKAAMAASVPWPSASGARRNTMIPETRPPSATTNGIAHGRDGVGDRGSALPDRGRPGGTRPGRRGSSAGCLFERPEERGRAEPGDRRRSAPRGPPTCAGRPHVRVRRRIRSSRLAARRSPEDVEGVGDPVRSATSVTPDGREARWRSRRSGRDDRRRIRSRAAEPVVGEAGPDCPRITLVPRDRDESLGARVGGAGGSSSGTVTPTRAATSLTVAPSELSPTTSRTPPLGEREAEVGRGIVQGTCGDGDARDEQALEQGRRIPAAMACAESIDD